MLNPLPGIGTEPGETSYLLVQLADELYAIPDTMVREITRWREITIVPGAPPALPGIISQRGQVLPVVDLRRLLDMEHVAPDRQTRLVITHCEEADMALRVDAVLDLHHFAAEALEPVPGTLDPQRARLLRSVARHEEQPVAVLDVPEVITLLRAGG